MSDPPSKNKNIKIFFKSQEDQLLNQLTLKTETYDLRGFFSSDSTISLKMGHSDRNRYEAITLDRGYDHVKCARFYTDSL